MRLGCWGIVALMTAARMVVAQELPRPLPPEKPQIPDQVAPRTAFQRPLLGPPGTIVPDTPAILPPQPPGTYLPEGARVPLPAGSTRQIFRFAPRYDRYNATLVPSGPNEQRLTFVGGLIVNITYETAPAKPGESPGVEEIEFAADSGVVWIKNGPAGDALSGFTQETKPGEKPMESELFLMGNVVIRTKAEAKIGTTAQNVTNTLRAEQIFYDVNGNRCIALNANLELATEGTPDAVYLTGQEVQRLGQNEWRAFDAEAFASRLPSDPSLILESGQISYTRRRIVRQNIFGVPYRNPKTGATEVSSEQILTGRNVVGRYVGVPFFYLPYLRTDASDPLGPLAGIGFGNDRIFGFQFFTTWDPYKLLALRPPQGHRWRLHLDYLGDRGPGIGSDYFYSNTRGGLFGGRMPEPTDDDYALGEWTLDGPNRGESRLYGLSDGGRDLLGGLRNDKKNPAYRGRAFWFHDQDFLNDTKGYRWARFQGQFAYQSDRDFREQFYKQEFDTARNLESYAYLNGGSGNLGGSLLLQGNTFRPWVTETQSLPRADAYWLGETFFDLLNYNARASAGYYRFHPAEQAPLPVLPTDQTAVNLGRFHLNQELSAPFDLGPFRLTPYGTVDLAYYTQDRSGDSTGRLYGGGGARASLPYQRLYESVDSELFNLKGLMHKGQWSLNYLYAKSNVDYQRLPQLDRLNDDAIDQSYRYIRPLQSLYVPGPAGVALQNSSLFDPQNLAIRRLVENRVDTLDDMHVFQFENHHRFQTKRGFPGSEHTVDYLTLDTGISFYPQKDRDNFGKSWSNLNYAALWNVGDRTAITSSGWFDPFDSGAKYFSVGTNLNRPDGTNFYVGYRQIDPIRSRAVTAAIGYQLSRRYSTFLSSTYDFGIQSALSNTIMLNRIGTDVTISLGFTYNAIVNNFGVQLTVIPNIVGLFANPMNGRIVGTQNLGIR